MPNKTRKKTMTRQITIDKTETEGFAARIKNRGNSQGTQTVELYKDDGNNRTLVTDQANLTLTPDKRAYVLEAPTVFSNDSYGQTLTMEVVTENMTRTVEVYVGGIPPNVVLNVTASDYDPTNNKYVANIGPDVPDAGGDPTKTNDTVAGTSGVDVVDYNGTNDYSQTTQISTSNDVIAIVWTGKVKTANNNDYYVDGGSLLELLMNDDDTKDGWRLFRGGSDQAVNNSGSVTTDYVTYSLIGRNGNEVGLKINNNLVAGFAAGGSAQQLTGATIGARGDGSAGGSRFIEYSVIDSGTVAGVDKEAARQGDKHGIF